MARHENEELYDLIKQKQQENRQSLARGQGLRPNNQVPERWRSDYEADNLNQFARTNEYDRYNNWNSTGYSAKFEANTPDYTVNVHYHPTVKPQARTPILKKWQFWAGIACVAVLAMFGSMLSGGGKEESQRRESSLDRAQVEERISLAESKPKETAQIISSKPKSVPMTIVDSTHEESGFDVSATIDEEENSQAVIRHRDVSLEDLNSSSHTPLTDFYVHLFDDHTLTIETFETYDPICLIASSYTIDGETWRTVEIGEACFFGRTMLDTVVIPEGVVSIAHNAFNSTSLKQIYLPKSLKNVNNMFDYFNHGVTVRYAGTSGDWSNILNVGKMPDNVTIEYGIVAPAITDSTNYNSSTLTTDKSSGEELGESVVKAFSGFIYGFAEGLNGE